MSCPKFVPLIETNNLRSWRARRAVEEYLSPLIEQKIDTLIYGCTHYRLLEPLIRDVLPPQVILVDPAEQTIVAAEQELELMGLRNGTGARPTRFCASGCPEDFAQKAAQCLGSTPAVEKIHLQSLHLIHLVVLLQLFVQFHNL